MTYQSTMSLATLLAGEDQTNNWMQTANGANQYYTFLPNSTGAAGGSSGALIGLIGAAGDYLDKLQISSTSTNSGSQNPSSAGLETSRSSRHRARFSSTFSKFQRRYEQSKTSSVFTC